MIPKALSITKAILSPPSNYREEVLVSIRKSFSWETPLLLAFIDLFG